MCAAGRRERVRLPQGGDVGGEDGAAVVQAQKDRALCGSQQVPCIAAPQHHRQPVTDQALIAPHRDHCGAVLAEDLGHPFRVAASGRRPVQPQPAVVQGGRHVTIPLLPPSQ